MMDEDLKSYFIFVFSTEKEILIDKAKNYFPSTSVKINSEDVSETSWKLITEAFVKEHFFPKNEEENWVHVFTKNCKLSRILRLWFPLSTSRSTFLHRHIFWKKFTPEERENFQTDDDFQWTGFESVSTTGADPEMNDILTRLNKVSGDLGFKAQEFLEDNFLHFAQEPASDSPESTSNAHLALMAEAKFGKEEQILIYRDFFRRCLPQLFMGFEKFRSLMVCLGWEETSLVHLFRCFKNNSITRDPHFLSFHELVSGLAICQPTTPHGDLAGEIRCRYIFKYYDKNSDNKLDFEEFCELVRDIRRKRDMSTDAQDVKTEASQSAQVFGSSDPDNLSLAEFLEGVGQLKFRGTSKLLRSKVSVTDYLKRLSHETSRASEPLVKKRKVSDDDFMNSEMGTSKSDRRRGSLTSDPSLPSFLFSFDSDSETSTSSECETDDKEYEFATHVIKVKRSGQISEAKSLWELPGGAVSASAEFSSSLRFDFCRMESISAFNVSSDANEMLKGLRYFEKLSKADPMKKPLSWGNVDLSTVASSLISICRQVKSLLIQEPRLLKIKAPVYVLGDIHGNFRDLICFEKTLWRMGPNLTPSSFLFLGDYVDRGDFGVEVIAYLFAQKIIAPTKFHLLRGNHEDRNIQKNFTFHKECLSKFGEKLGKQVWESINLVFDVMPIAAVVDKKIFCVHGGIPPPWLGKSIHSLNQVAVDLPTPESQEPLVWEYLWNDPIPGDGSELPETLRNELSAENSSGFVENFRRGTGHMFSVQALDEFLKRNNLSLVIRAHEVKLTGFQVQQNQKLLTVFSSSKYCNGINEAACVLIDNKKLRIIRLDTS